MKRWLRGLWRSPVSIKLVAGAWLLIYLATMAALVRDVIRGDPANVPLASVGGMTLTLIAAYLTIVLLRLSWWAVLASLIMAAYLAWFAWESSRRSDEAGLVLILVNLLFSAPLALLLAAVVRHWRRLSWHPLGRTEEAPEKPADIFS